MLMLCAFVCAFISARLRCEFWILSFLELLLMWCLVWSEQCLWLLLFGEFLTLWKLYSVRWTWERKKKKKKGGEGRIGAYLFQRARRYLEVDFLGAQRLQQGDSVGAVMAVSVFPRVQQSVVVPRMFGKADVAVAVGRWKDPFQRGTSGKFILGEQQTSHVVRSQLVEDGAKVL